MSYGHPPPLEDMEPNPFISFLSWGQYVEAMESNYPGFESTTSKDLVQIAYLSESQFPHLQKGYDNTDGHGTVVRIKRIPFHSVRAQPATLGKPYQPRKDAPLSAPPLPAPTPTRGSRKDSS